MKKELPDDFYRKIKPRLHRRIGREVRLAHRVLDLGCGSCDLVRYLASAYGQEVVGVDICDNSFPSRRRTSAGNRYHCLKKNADSLSFAGASSADAIVSMWALHEMAKPLAILREAGRVLRPGGKIFIVDFPRDSLAQRLWNEEYLQPHEVKALLEQTEFREVQVRLVENGQVMWARGYRPVARQTHPEQGKGRLHGGKTQRIGDHQR